MEGKPIVERTGLTDSYDFTLTWSETDGPSVFTALSEQLGLRVESQKVSVKVLVIDHIERPTPN
jgi:uncharacterized protein (TIGR03435 family)